MGSGPMGIPKALTLREAPMRSPVSLLAACGGESVTPITSDVGLDTEQQTTSSRGYSPIAW